MTQAEFHILLIAASFSALRFAKRYVTNDLPVEAFEYRICLNNTCPPHRNEAGSTPPERRFSEQEAVDLLYRDGTCPEWIDVNAEAVSEGATVFRLICCERYTDDKSKMYYSKRGLGPFGVKSPNLPFGYSNGDRFTLPPIQP
jgi:hypothetical protein